VCFACVVLSWYKVSAYRPAVESVPVVPSARLVPFVPVFSRCLLSVFLLGCGRCSSSGVRLVPFPWCSSRYQVGSLVSGVTVEPIPSCLSGIRSVPFFC